MKKLSDLTLDDAPKVPESGTAVIGQLETIDLARVVDNEQNFYHVDEESVAELAANIATHGLQQPIVVYVDAAGQFVLLSGHRRTAALRLLAKDEPEKWSKVSAVVDRRSLSPAFREYQLIAANADTRKQNNHDLAMQAERLEACLYALAEEGYEFPGRMRDHVAKAVGASKSKLSRLKVIEDKLNDGFREKWQNGKIPEATAYALAQLPDNVQKEIADFSYGDLTNYGDGAYKAKDYADKITKLPANNKAVHCSECSHGDTMKQKIWKSATWESSCSGCCMDCVKLEICKDSCTFCSAVIEKKTQLKQRTKEMKAEDKAKEAARVAPELEYLNASLSRIFHRMEEKGLSVPDLQKIGTRTYEANANGDYLLLSGVKKASEGTRIPLGYGLSYGECKTLIDAAAKLECSIDWLLTGKESGKVPAPGGESVSAPNAGWKNGHPDAKGRYLCWIRTTWGAISDILLFDGDDWKIPEDVAEDYREVLYWIEKPE